VVSTTIALAATVVTLTGAGATFPYPLYSRWFAEYNKLHPDVRINYQPIGSGGGIQQVKNGTVDFGASDVALSDNQLKQMPGDVLQIPMTAGPVVLTYNPSGIGQPLKLTPEVIARIYLGNLTNWNDNAIAAANAGIHLPDRAILVIHRSDGSGTTNIFSSYLSAVSDDWKNKIGKGTSVNWPTGLGGKGNDGVAGLVRQTDGAVGYVELAYALQNHLPMAHVQNKAGRFVTPSPEGVTAAMNAFAKDLDRDIRTPIVNAPSPDAYPISGFTFLLVPKSGGDATRRQALKAYIEWAISSGQQLATELHYAKLPPSIVALDRRLAAEIR
jgi:phosphate transport system substrate-binding protein